MIRLREESFRESCMRAYPKERLIQLKTEPMDARRFPIVSVLAEEDPNELRSRYLHCAGGLASNELSRAYLQCVDLKSVDESGVFFRNGETIVPTGSCVVKDDGSHEDVNLMAAHVVGQHVFEALYEFDRAQCKRISVALLPDSTGLTYDRASDTYTINGTRVTTDALNMARDNAPSA